MRAALNAITIRAEETVNYHCDVLEAKIALGENLIISIDSEFIENNGEDTSGQKEKVVGGHYPRMQLECYSDEESLPDDTDIGYGKAAV